MHSVTKHTAILLLGGNVGNRLSYINKAVEQIKEKCGTISAQSKIYETASWGIETLPAHLNMALQITTTFSPEKLLTVLQNIENNLDRKRSNKWGERTIDIDILYFDDQIIHTENLIIPHPFIQMRRFALVPVCDIAATYIHPILLKTNKELLVACTDILSVIEYEKP